MLTASFRRTTILLLLVAVLAAPWASAAAPRIEIPEQEKAVQTAPSEFFGRLWSFLWNLRSKEGCRIDPNGRCVIGPAQPPAQTKSGCHIDPFGRCVP